MFTKNHVVQLAFDKKKMVVSPTACKTFSV